MQKLSLAGVIAHLTDELVLKSALLGQSRAAEEKNRAGLELCELQAKVDELLLSHDQAEANAAKQRSMQDWSNVNCRRKRIAAVS